MALNLKTFVFIDEDQQKKYSKNTLSAINAQVAKYAHKQRKVVQKSSSAPSSPPSASSKHDQCAEAGITQDDQLNARSQRTIHLTVKARRRSAELQKTPNHTKEPFGKERRKSLSKSQPVNEPQHGLEISKQNQQTEDTAQSNDKSSEELSEWFEKLCNITKVPVYQAFPFFLDLEERRLTHYCT